LQRTPSFIESGQGGDRLHVLDEALDIKIKSGGSSIIFKRQGCSFFQPLKEALQKDSKIAEMVHAQIEVTDMGSIGEYVFSYGVLPTQNTVNY
jgi:thioredoxin-related protein